MVGRDLIDRQAHQLAAFDDQLIVLLVVRPGFDLIALRSIGQNHVAGQQPRFIGDVLPNQLPIEFHNIVVELHGALYGIEHLDRRGGIPVFQICVDLIARVGFVQRVLPLRVFFPFAFRRRLNLLVAVEALQLLRAHHHADIRNLIVFGFGERALKLCHLLKVPAGIRPIFRDVHRAVREQFGFHLFRLAGISLDRQVKRLGLVVHDIFTELLHLRRNLFFILFGRKRQRRTRERHQQRKQQRKVFFHGCSLLEFTNYFLKICLTERISSPFGIRRR